MRTNHALIFGLASRNKYIPSLQSHNYIGGYRLHIWATYRWPTISKRTFPNATISEVCQELLGNVPRPGKDTTIKFKWLEENPKPSKKKNEMYKTRAYLFFLVASQIFLKTSGARGPAWLLELFREFKPCAWGRTCLRACTKYSKWLERY